MHLLIVKMHNPNSSYEHSKFNIIYTEQNPRPSWQYVRIISIMCTISLCSKQSSICNTHTILHTWEFDLFSRRGHGHFKQEVIEVTLHREGGHLSAHGHCIQLLQVHFEWLMNWLGSNQTQALGGIQLVLISRETVACLRADWNPFLLNVFLLKRLQNVEDFSVFDRFVEG